MATQCIDYNFAEIEKHWQKFWEQNETFKAPNQSDKPKYYLLDMFPYPSGAGLHAGHVENFAGSDVLGRFMMARGYNVLHPMGWDAFGLPAEQYAVKTGTHPAVTTRQNIQNFRRQIKSIGLGIDWSREINTTDPHYFRWTQWIFLQLFKHGLAYVDERPVNWCPTLGTVLANEEIVEGKSEVGGHPVERRNLRQWVLRITAYADKLLDGLENLDWPESTKAMQRNWIGRSTGAEVIFDIENIGEQLPVFTTRPDTLYGATYMVLAPEHPLVKQLTTEDYKDTVGQYITRAAGKSDLDRTELSREKTGVFTGSYAINPVNKARIPIWIADYVLMSYGTGAIMAVPAHDERDYEFAKVFDLPIIPVVTPDKDLPPEDVELPFIDKGFMVNSQEFDGLPTDEGKNRVIDKLQNKKRGKASINYRLRDWLFSRQRYWGEPFPVVWVEPEAYEAIRAHTSPVSENLPENPVTYDEGGKSYYAVPIPESALPLELPETDNFQPSGSGESPLAKVPEWLNVVINAQTGEVRSRNNGVNPDGETWFEGFRETNTMPQWAGSCWYYLRYLDPHNTEKILADNIRDYWGVPDFYMGGAEHAVLHLLYARFWHKFLADIGVLNEPEPFTRLYHQGIILGEDGEKMSKSRGNVVNPDEYMDSHGADSLRCYLMFMGPLEDKKPWKSQGIEGTYRFLRKVWREFMGEDGKPSEKLTQENEDSKETDRIFHETVKKVTADYEAIRFNTAISQMMIFMNHASREPRLHIQKAKQFSQLLAPLAPHLAEELWERLGESPSVVHAPWPDWDESVLVVEEVKIGFLVNGKPRSEAMVGKEATQEDVLKIAKRDSRVASHLDGKTIRKVVFVPGKILNIVAN